MFACDDRPTKARHSFDMRLLLGDQVSNRRVLLFLVRKVSVVLGFGVLPWPLEVLP